MENVRLAALKYKVLFYPQYFCGILRNTDITPLRSTAWFEGTLSWFHSAIEFAGNFQTACRDGQPKGPVTSISDSNNFVPYNST